MNRNEVESLYKWNTSDIFASDDSWQEEYEKLLKDIDFSEFKGQLSSDEDIENALLKQSKLSQRLERIYLYAHMKKDEDNGNTFYSSMQAKASSLYVKFSAEVSFITPCLTSLDSDKLLNLSKMETLSVYDYFFKCLIKEKPHILSDKEERLLSLGGDVFSSFKNVFTMIDNVDASFGEIEFEGENMPLSHGLYSVILHGEDRDLRETAFKQYYKGFISLINTISETYFGNVKKDVYLKTVRGYNTSLEKALEGEDVEPIIYKNLIESVESYLPVMHEYINCRKNALGVDTLHMYDLYAPVCENAEIKLPFEKAYDLVIEGLAPLGKEYASLLKKAKDERWIDVYETENKRSGAYSTGCYGVHPYVLLNYQETTNDIFTIAHEMGHSIHTYFSNENQPYEKADYTIFVAEVASTVNEVLLLKYLLSKTEDNKLKKYLLSYYLDMIRTTLFRQTMFAEFEDITHSLVEKGEPLNKDNMCKAYYDLNVKYYGSGVVNDDEIAYEWARIPHFYTSFYVYKYATGITSAIKIASRILSEGVSAVKDYFKFLSSGGSDSPNNLLKLTGVDLTKKESFSCAMEEFRSALEEFKKCL